MVRVACLRHGETDRNVKGIFSGMGSESISEAQRQALAAMFFDTSEYEAIYCSPAQRCLDTADALGIDGLIVEPRLAERAFGVFEGLTVQECRNTYSSEFEAFQRLDGEFVIPGGESRIEHLDRITAWLKEIDRYDRVLAVTHGGTIDFLYRLGTGQPIHGGTSVFAGPNAARSTFEVSWPSVRMIEHGVPLV